MSSLFKVIESFTYKFLLNDTSPSVMRLESFRIVRSPPLMSTNPLTYMDLKQFAFWDKSSHSDIIL